LEAVAEEEGGDAVRLLTIHAAKGLEFKVVIVADAGRDRPPPSSEEILALADGRFGFRVVHPLSLQRVDAFDYRDVRAARRAEEEAEKLRLYYVAMTRAVDRLIVSGALEPGGSGGSTPLGWVLDRLSLAAELAPAGEEPVEVERGGARVLLRVDRFRAEPEVLVEPAADEEQLVLFESLEEAVRTAPAAPRLPLLVDPAPPPLHRPRRLSFTALAQFGSCSYKYFALRVAGMRELRPRRPAGEGEGALFATEVGDAVHRLLELVDLRRPVPPPVEQVRDWYPSATDEELDRIRGFVTSYCESDLARRLASLDGVLAERPFAFEHDGVLLQGRVDVLRLALPDALVVDYKTNLLGDTSPEDVVEEGYRLQRLVYALACFRAGAERVEVVYHFLERADAVVSTVFGRNDVAALERGLSAAIAEIHAERFVPTPSEFACSTCPALDLVCAGPRLATAPVDAPAAIPV
jgi:ATP-dependent helicase/nuclease subunit A